MELGIQHLGAFVVAGLLLNLTPGPDLLYCSHAAATGGRRAGWIAALGISTGCLGHVLLGAIGVSALLAASATAFALLKLAGAAWLVWLGCRMLRTPPTEVEHDPSRPPRPARSRAAIFREGVLINLLNPKVAIFFLAFVPQFIDPQGTHPTLAFALLGLLFVVNGTLVTGLLATLTGAAAQRLRAAPPGARPARLLARLRTWLPRTIGACFIALGARLALDTR